MDQPEIEIIQADVARGRFRFVLFDFDGTLSLLREGWPDVMIPMMVEYLRKTPHAEDETTLASIVEEFVMRLNGRQTIYQMMRLAEEIEKRSGAPLDPLEYKRDYHDRLLKRIQHRLDSLESGEVSPDHWTVPGSHAMLAALRGRGLQLYLASGTDLVYVKREAELLNLTLFFGEHIYGALDDYANFSKKMVIERILAEHQLRGNELLGFGDGFVEIEEIKRVGGVAVAVASDERNRGRVNQWKRDRLIRAGADIVIPDYRDAAMLIEYLLDDDSH